MVSTLVSIRGSARPGYEIKANCMKRQTEICSILIFFFLKKSSNLGQQSFAKNTEKIA